MNFKKILLDSIKIAIKSVSPENCIKKNVKLINSNTLKIKNQIINLTQFSKINLIAFGKASILMTKAITKLIPFDNGIIVSNQELPESYSYLKKFEFIKAGHPLPNENSFLAGKKILEFATKTEDNHVTFVLISGGGSALVEHSNISLKEFQSITDLLLKSGANIHELNIVRKHLSMIKGGKLLRKLKGRVISLIISDVIGDKLDIIASGPTFYDNTTLDNVIRILKKYNISTDIKKFFQPCLTIDEFRKKDITNIIIGNNKEACNEIIKFLKGRGFSTLYLGSQIQGEAKEVAKVFGGIATEIYNNNISIKKPAAIIAGGETTVKVVGDGKGGRNQELTLAISPFFKEIEGIFAAFGTDGIDGFTDAAGAIIDKDTLLKAEKLKLNWENYLLRNDSYNFFKNTDSLIITGSTGTNVADIFIGLIN